MLGLNLELPNVASVIARGGNPFAAYAAGGLTPEYVLDFNKAKFSVDGSSSTSANAVDFSTNGNRTMLDSDGVLKWAPHNFVLGTERTTEWGNINTTQDDGQADPNGGNTAQRITDDATNGLHTASQSNIHAITYKRTTEVLLKQDTARYAFVCDRPPTTGATAYVAVIDLQNGTLTNTPTVQDNVTLTDEGDGWYKLFYDNDATSGVYDNFYIGISSGPDLADIEYSGSGDSIFFAWPRIYRSDLGGMAPVPVEDRVAGSETYVPTTDSAVYLRREKAYTYVDGELVGPYQQHESEARTNVLLDSEDFTTVNWTPVGLQSISGSSPFNLLEDASTSQHSINQGVTVSTGQNLVFWAIVEAAGRNFARLNPFGSPITGSDSYAEFDLINGTVSGAGGLNIDEGIISFGPNLWLIWMVTETASSDGTINMRVGPSSDGLQGTANYAGSDGDGIKVYRTQVEVGSTPSSYIPTNGSTVTRPAETLTAPSANLPWPEPNVIGPELVDTLPTGSLDLSSFEPVSQLDTCIVGKVYFFDVIVSDYVSGAFQIGTGSQGVSANRAIGIMNANGTYRAPFLATDTSIEYRALSSGFEGNVSISVHEIEPLSVSIALENLETYADEGTAGQVTLADWRTDANNRITLTLDTDGAKTGTFTLTMVNGGSSESISTTGEITPGINKPFNVAIVATLNEIGIALDGTAETRVSHSIGLPDLEAEDLEFEGMGYRSLVRVWGEDITNAGQAEATS